MRCLRCSFPTLCPVVRIRCSGVLQLITSPRGAISTYWISLLVGNSRWLVIRRIVRRRIKGFVGLDVTLVSGSQHLWRRRLVAMMAMVRNQSHRCKIQGPFCESLSHDFRNRCIAVQCQNHSDWPPPVSKVMSQVFARTWNFGTESGSSSPLSGSSLNVARAGSSFGASTYGSHLDSCSSLARDAYTWCLEVVPRASTPSASLFIINEAPPSVCWLLSVA